MTVSAYLNGIGFTGSLWTGGRNNGTHIIWTSNGELINSTMYQGGSINSLHGTDRILFRQSVSPASPYRGLQREWEGHWTFVLCEIF